MHISIGRILSAACCACVLAQDRARQSGTLVEVRGQRWVVSDTLPRGSRPVMANPLPPALRAILPVLAAYQGRARAQTLLLMPTLARTLWT
jgi:hypothetical protein